MCGQRCAPRPARGSRHGRPDPPERSHPTDPFSTESGLSMGSAHAAFTITAIAAGLGRDLRRDVRCRASVGGGRSRRVRRLRGGLHGDLLRRCPSRHGPDRVVVADGLVGCVRHLRPPTRRGGRVGRTVDGRDAGRRDSVVRCDPVGGAAFLTVPASLVVGDFFGDPGLVEAQPVLPHFGYVLLVVAATVPATALMVASTRIGSSPRWWKSVTVIVAPLLVVTGPSVVTMLPFPSGSGHMHRSACARYSRRADRPEDLYEM